MIDEPADDNAALRAFADRRAKRLFWLVLAVLALFLVPQIVMMCYQALSGKLPT